MSLIFNQRVKHGKLDFHPKVVYQFEDPDAPVYFKAMGWASETSETPDVTISLAECDIDPDTVFADGPNKGRKVMEVAANG